MRSGANGGIGLVTAVLAGYSHANRAHLFRVPVVTIMAPSQIALK